MDDQNKNDQPLPDASVPQQPMQPQPPVPPQTPPQPSVSGVQQPGSYAQPAQPYGQPQVPNAQPSPYYQPMAPRSSGKAVGALICGILAILFAWLPLIGVILGVVAIVLAVQSVKQAGKDGKATGGKVCGIVGIVLSVLSFFVWMALGLGLMAYIAAESYDSAYSGSSSVAPLESGSGSSSATESEQNIEAAVATQLDKLKAKDSSIVLQLASDADEALEGSLDIAFSDLGIDPALFVDWALTDFDYELDEVFDYGDGTGIVYVDLTLRDTMAFATTFMNDVQAAIDAGEMQSLDEAGSKALLGELYSAAMGKTTSMTTSYISLDMLQEGSTWKIDDDSWETNLDYLFGL